MSENILELKPNGDDTEIVRINSKTGDVLFYENKLTKVKMEIVPWEGSYIPNGISSIDDVNIEKFTKVTSVDGMVIKKAHEIVDKVRGIFCGENDETGINEYHWSENEDTFLPYLITSPDGVIKYSDNFKYSVDETYPELDLRDSIEILDNVIGTKRIYKDGVELRSSILEDRIRREYFHEGKLVKRIESIETEDAVFHYSTLFDSNESVVLESKSVVHTNGTETISKYPDKTNFYSVVHDNDYKVELFKDKNNSYLSRCKNGFIHTYNHNPLDCNFIMYYRLEFGVPMFIDVTKVS